MTPPRTRDEAEAAVQAHWRAFWAEQALDWWCAVAALLAILINARG